MTLVPEDLTKWDNESLLRAYERNEETLKYLVGSLYPSILYDENEKIGQECIRRSTYHPNLWRDQNIVESSWTSADGLVHTWWHRHAIQSRKPDDPPKVITCVDCLAR